MSCRIPEVTKECRVNPTLWVIARAGAKRTFQSGLIQNNVCHFRYMHCVAGKVYGVEAVMPLCFLLDSKQWRALLAYHISEMRKSVKDRARSDNPNIKPDQT